ncbi:CorA family divalent cation transporter [Halotalea alkalilenta]|uniref:Magnesium transporter CorA n=1 Tax=Halotalea alkalilenta TaxID=376489 RepID=A0A172YIC5_9GAMM|nr:CorA family divalent cation transporter [Halotalea alkalilenta]ANF58946.1 magnesium transporter CorA [Halotalea alkalilenta]
MAQTGSALVAAYRLDGKGGGNPLSTETLNAAWDSDPNDIWMHLDFTFADADYYLSTLAELDEALIEALLEEYTRPRVARFSGGLMTTLRGVNLNPGEAPDDLISLRVWLSHNRLITLRRRPLQAIQQVRDDLASGSGASNVTALMVEMADHMIDQMGELLLEIDEALSQGEEKMLTGTELNGDDLARLRRPMITLRRFMEPQYDCLNRLCDASLGLDETNRLALREVANHLYRYIEDVRAMQERALIIQEQIWSIHNERLNSRMYLLSIITVLFLPLTFLTGLLGINVGGIPGANNPYGFALVLVLCLLVSVLVLAAVWGWQRYRQRG